MTYQDFRRLFLAADDCVDLDVYIAEEGGSVPTSIPDARIIPLLTDIWMYHHSPTARCLRDMVGLSQAAFARDYKLPQRTLENWESRGDNARTAPGYVLDLLAYAVICDKYLGA